MAADIRHLSSKKDVNSPGSQFLLNDESTFSVHLLGKHLLGPDNQRHFKPFPQHGLNGLQTHQTGTDGHDFFSFFSDCLDLICIRDGS